MASSTRPTEQNVWILNQKPSTNILPDTFKLLRRPLPDTLQEGQSLVKVNFFSNDPAQRMWMQAGVNPRRLYTEPMNEGEPVRSYGLATILETKSTKYQVGQQILGSLGWFDYGVISDAEILSEAVSTPDHPLLSLTVFGLTGLTAWAGLFGVYSLKPEHTVVISGAAGSTGSICVQIAKNVVGCKKVIGIAGGPEKCQWVKSLGADDCVDYKSPDYKDRLAELLPDYADMYYDNVGGEVLNTMLPLVKRYGHVVACGAIANYHGQVQQLSNWMEIIGNRITIKGLLVLDHLNNPDMLPQLKKWFAEGKITDQDSLTTVETKIEDVPTTWGMLFSGGNKGKLVTKLV